MQKFWEIKPSTQQTAIVQYSKFCIDFTFCQHQSTPTNSCIALIIHSEKETQRLENDAIFETFANTYFTKKPLFDDSATITSGC